LISAAAPLEWPTCPTFALTVPTATDRLDGAPAYALATPLTSASSMRRSPSAESSTYSTALASTPPVASAAAAAASTEGPSATASIEAYTRGAVAAARSQAAIRLSTSAPAPSPTNTPSLEASKEAAGCCACDSRTPLRVLVKSASALPFRSTPAMTAASTSPRASHLLASSRQR